MPASPSQQAQENADLTEKLRQANAEMEKQDAAVVDIFQSKLPLILIRISCPAFRTSRQDHGVRKPPGRTDSREGREPEAPKQRWWAEGRRGTIAKQLEEKRGRKKRSQGWTCWYVFISLWFGVTGHFRIREDRQSAQGKHQEGHFHEVECRNGAYRRQESRRRPL